MKTPLRLLNDFRDIVQLYSRALWLVWEASPVMTALTFLLITLTALTIPLQVWISKIMIDQIAALVGQNEPLVWQSVLLSPAFYVAIWAVSQVAQSVSQSLRDLVVVRTEHHTRHLILKKAATLDLAFFENPTFFDRLSMARRETYRLANLAYQLLEFVPQVITLLSLLLLLYRIAPGLPGVLIVIALPKIITHSFFTRKKAMLYLRHVPAERMMYYTAGLLSERETAKEIRLFQLQHYLLGRHHKAGEEYVQNMAGIAVSQEKASFLGTLLSLTGTAGIWIYTGLEALAGRISLGDIALIFQAIERSRSALDQLAFTTGVLTENTVYLNTLFAFLDLQPDGMEGALSRRTEQPVHIPDLNGPIEFQHVSFRYPGADREALHDISFTLRPGEKVALVGENGAGKTTLVKLLARLYGPTRGRITIQTQDLCEFAPETYYRQIGVIFQDFVHYDFTARENIGFGNIEALQNESCVRRAAQLGGADELIESLPQKYDTMLGKRFDNGVELSSGQWQKLALSRAFIRDAPLLILDEPTAALDAFAESDVYRRFADLTKGKTTLFVTHRLSSVQMAEKILVLKDGRLIEEGDHETLMAHNGEYARMFNLQAERYQMAPGAATD